MKLKHTKDLYKNLLNEIKYANESKAISNNSKKIKKKRLITFNNFKKHILDPNKNPLLNKFRKKRYLVEANSSLQIEKNRFTIYQSPKTNKQFSTIFNQDNIIYQNRLLEMIAYFTVISDKNKIDEMIKNNNSDDKILNYIKKNFKIKNARKDKVVLYKMTKICDKIIKYTKKNKNNNNEEVKILDVGVGNGKKLRIIKQLTNFKIYGADIKEWGPYKSEKSFNFPFKYINENPYKIDYESKMFDCITLILTLHHAKNIFDVIKECKRLLKDDGILVIIEHDIWNDYDNMIIDLQHRIYNKIFNEKEQTIGDYYNFMEWDMIFYKCGFEPVYADRLVDDIGYTYRYDLQFMTIFKKIIKN